MSALATEEPILRELLMVDVVAPEESDEGQGAEPLATPAGLLGDEITVTIGCSWIKLKEWLCKLAHGPAFGRSEATKREGRLIK